METKAYHHDRSEALKLVLMATGMFGASLFLLYLGLFTDFRLALMGPATGPMSIIVGTIGSLFFGYAFFFILRRVLFPQNALVITDEGIIDQTNGLGTKNIIPFSNMREAKLELINSSPQIGINMYDDAKYFESLSYIKRKMAEINKKHFGTSTVSLSVPHDSRAELHEIIDIINDRIEITKGRKQMTN